MISWLSCSASAGISIVGGARSCLTSSHRTFPSADSDGTLTAPTFAPSDGDFTDAIFELERFLDKYKNHPNTDYAYYLLAICHYNLIVDEKKDLGEIIKAKDYFILLIEEFPTTDFAEDAKFKLELIQEILASKELYLANYYLDREKWIPAMNRYKKIVNDYDTTIFIEEALYRLVELNYKLGLTNEAKKYSALLGYNYQSSDWYERSYKILNKNYKKQQLNKISKKENSLLKRIKSLFE